MDEDFISIKEFAEYLGITIQAVYKRLDKLSPDYIKEVNGKKLISKSATSQFSHATIKVTREYNDKIDELNGEIEHLNNDIKQLKDQLSRATMSIIDKDKEIEKLKSALQEKDSYIDGLKADKIMLKDSFDKALELQKDNFDKMNNALLIEQRRAVALLEDQQKKKGLFSRIFHKDKEIEVVENTDANEQN